MSEESRPRRKHVADTAPQEPHVATVDATKQKLSELLTQAPIFCGGESDGETMKKIKQYHQWLEQLRGLTK